MQYLQILNKYKVFYFIILVAMLVLFMPICKMHNYIWGKIFIVIFIIVVAYYDKMLAIILFVFAVILHNTSPYYDGFTGDLIISQDPSKNINISALDPSMATTLTTDGAITKQFDVSGELIIEPNNVGTGQEGFDLIGAEDALRIGKQSNSITIKKPYSYNYEYKPYEEAQKIEGFLIL